jgi:pimeloyl-ACP methyl ester carboxylesterase
MPWLETAAELERARAERPEIVPSTLGDLFGILTPPAAEAPAAGTGVILLTRPRSHRNRMWVEAARRLALAGFHAFRFDYHGCGDSGGSSAYLDPSEPYRADVVTVIRHLRSRHGLERFILCGSCFDARTALSAFADEAAAIDGLVFMAAPIMRMSTLHLARADQRDWKHLGRALWNPENWRALARAERWRYMAQVVGRIGRNSLRPGLRDTEALPLDRGFLEHFEALVRSRARALFLYGEDDVEYQSFRVAETHLFPRLSAADRARFTIEIWPGDLHSFLDTPRQRESLTLVLGWIEALHPARAAAAAGRR